VTRSDLPPPPPDRLPDGFTVRLASDTRRLDPATLLGGSPLRLLRLAPRAAVLLAGDRLVVGDATTAALAARLLDAGAAHPEPGPPPADAEPTVVVPVRDRAGGLDRLLSAVRADPTTAVTRVVVVDDGSADPAAVAAVAAAHGADLLRREVSRGPAAARNTGLRAATTPVVVFLDSDCVPRPGWLAPLLGHLADPRLAAVAPRITALPAQRPGWLAAYEAAGSALDMGERPAAVRPLSAVAYVPSAALVARRAALGSGFDAGLRVAEDVDLVWRLLERGWRVRYEPASEVAHAHPTTTQAWLARRAYYGTGAAPLAARHGGAVAPLVVSPWSAAAWGLALLGGRPGRLAALGVLGVASARLATRLRRPGEPAPARLSAALVLRGTGWAGRALLRAAVRHYWPATAGLALVSRRARRLLLLAAAADALDGWWPMRGRLGLARFALARRLEDLAYGAGLWSGAVRVRQARALLPAAPPNL
jgi:mycofactocin system glycosyltransferase